MRFDLRSTIHQTGAYTTELHSEDQNYGSVLCDSMHLSYLMETILLLSKISVNCSLYCDTVLDYDICFVVQTDLQLVSNKYIS